MLSSTGSQRVRSTVRTVRLLSAHVSRPSGVLCSLHAHTTHREMDEVITTSETHPMLLDLNDACLYCVLAHLPSATDLVRLQTVCRRLRSVGLNNRLWIAWVYQDYGLLLDAASRRSTGVTSPSAGAQQLYGKLRTQLCPYSLHATAISTDGSCDEPYEAYWADNMFTCKQAVMYCSQSDTTNIHVFARLHPKHTSYNPSTHQLPGLVEPMTEEQRRRFTLDRCVQVAVKLVHPDTYAAHQADQQRQQHQGKVPNPHDGASSVLAGTAPDQQEQGGPLSRLLRRFVGTSTDTDKAAVVRRILDHCSTEGLVEFFLESFIAQVHHRPWAEDLYKGLDEEGRQMARWMAFLEYERKPEPRAEYKLVSVPLTPQSAVAASAAGSSTASTKQEQQHVLCDEGQLSSLAQWKQPGQNTSIVTECILARDGLGGSTCPVSSGLLYFGNFCSNSTSSSDFMSHNTSASSSAVAATLDGGAETASSTSCTQQQGDAVLSGLRHQAWVSASDNLVTAAAVFAAVDAGRLPAVLDYACNEQAEWIEFKQPSREQLVRQMHAEHTGTAAASSDGSAGSGSPGGAVMCPVLWFRFYPIGVQDDEPVSDAEEDYMSEEEPEQQGLPFDAVAVATGAVGVQADTDSNQEEEEEGAQGYDEYGEGEEEEGFPCVSDTARQEQQAGLGGVQQETGTEESGPMAQSAEAAAETSAAAEAAGTPVPRPAAQTALCEALPALPVLATEVSAALGYLPTHKQHKGYLAVQLQQPRAGNMLCMKLLNCEDVKPEFNSEKGGCNIDMQLVMLRGFELGEPPSGLVVAGVCA